ncbi:MAG: hypothetical protein CV081_02155 [Nitrospira sp. LK265]|nr:hypothetical protein [Nitrospira sp.]NGZ59293.1 hypothetical protein [Nitrospira sp. LK265]
MTFDLRQFEEYLENALHASNLYSLQEYAWEDADTPSSEYVGFAMWQTDQPDIDFNALMDLRPVARPPTDIETALLTMGEDYCGLMDSSRYSIGLMLLWYDDAMACTSRDQPFWSYYIDAVVKLAMASDRLRQLLIVTSTGRSVAKYNPNMRPTPGYAAPFESASQQLTARGIDLSAHAGLLDDIRPFGSAIALFRSRRNKIVHEAATRMALAVRQYMRDLSTKYNAEHTATTQPPGGLARPSEGPISSLVPTVDGQSTSDVAAALALTKDWYLRLIEAGNIVFQIDYWARRAQPK